MRVHFQRRRLAKMFGQYLDSGFCVWVLFRTIFGSLFTLWDFFRVIFGVSILWELLRTIFFLSLLPPAYYLGQYLDFVYPPSTLCAVSASNLENTALWWMYNAKSSGRPILETKSCSKLYTSCLNLKFDLIISCIAMQCIGRWAILILSFYQLCFLLIR